MSTQEIYEVSCTHLGGVHKATFWEKEDADDYAQTMFGHRASNIRTTRFVPVIEGAPTPDLLGELVELAEAIIGATTIDPKFGAAEWKLSQLAFAAKRLLAKVPSDVTTTKKES